MSIKFMSWNLQHFGSAGETHTARRGVLSLEFAQTVASLAVQNDVNIIGIMEVLPGGMRDLGTLLSALFSAQWQRGPALLWYCDWIKTCVGTATVGQAPADPDDLTFTSGARSEGYAVFWRADILMQPAPAPVSGGAFSPGMTMPPVANALTLSLAGRQPAAANGYPMAGFDPHNPGAVPFTPSLYPSTSDHGKNYWPNTRRPAVFSVMVPTAGAPETVQFLLFHAPSAKLASRAGTLNVALAKELYVDPAGNYAPHVVVGGDFNVDADEYRLGYSFFTDPFSTAKEGGANCAAGNPLTNPTKTTVTLDPLKKKPISRDINDYYGLPIDNIFYRTSFTATPEILLLPSMILWGDPHYDSRTKAVVQNWYGYLKSTGSDPFPTAIQSKWGQFLYQVRQGYFTSPWEAAAFVYYCLSDHMPLVLTIDC